MLVMRKSETRERGQAIVWVMLISVVGLTLGLSMISRNLSGIRQTGESESSNKAFSAAEAGIEEALYQIESSEATGSPVITPSAPTPLPEVDSEYEYGVSVGGDDTEVVIPYALHKDRVVELNLTGMSSTDNLEVYWVDQSVADEVSNPASLIIAYLAEDSTYVSGNGYRVEKFAYDPHSIQTDPDFEQASLCSPPCSVGSPAVGFRYQISGLAIPPADGRRVLRIMALHNTDGAGNSIPNTIGVKVIGANPVPFPAGQFYQVEATGRSGGGDEVAERKVEVIRSREHLPAVFDSVLLSVWGDLIQ